MPFQWTHFTLTGFQRDGYVMGQNIPVLRPTGRAASQEYKEISDFTFVIGEKATARSSLQPVFTISYYVPVNVLLPILVRGTKLKRKRAIVLGPSGVGKTCIVGSIDPSMRIGSGSNATTDDISMLTCGLKIADMPGYQSMTMDRDALDLLGNIKIFFELVATRGIGYTSLKKDIDIADFNAALQGAPIQVQADAIIAVFSAQQLMDLKEDVRKYYEKTNKMEVFNAMFRTRDGTKSISKGDNIFNLFAEISDRRVVTVVITKIDEYLIKILGIARGATSTSKATIKYRDVTKTSTFNPTSKLEQEYPDIAVVLDDLRAVVGAAFNVDPIMVNPRQDSVTTVTIIQDVVSKLLKRAVSQDNQLKSMVQITRLTRQVPKRILWTTIYHEMINALPSEESDDDSTSGDKGTTTDSGDGSTGNGNKPTSISADDKDTLLVMMDNLVEELLITKEFTKIANYTKLGDEWSFPTSLDEWSSWLRFSQEYVDVARKSVFGGEDDGALNHLRCLLVTAQQADSQFGASSHQVNSGSSSTLIDQPFDDDIPFHGAATSHALPGTLLDETTTQTYGTDDISGDLDLTGLDGGDAAMEVHNNSSPGDDGEFTAQEINYLHDVLCGEPEATATATRTRKNGDRLHNDSEPGRCVKARHY